MSATPAGGHFTLPVAAATGPFPLPPKAGGEGQSQGRLLANMMHFARTLRAAGLPVGPGKVIDAVEAVRIVGITDRRDFYWTLHAVFVNRPDQRLIFDQAFHVFWRNPDLLRKMMGLVLPELRIETEPDKANEMARRLAEALHPQAANGAADGRGHAPNLGSREPAQKEDHAKATTPGALTRKDSEPSQPRAARTR